MNAVGGGGDTPLHAAASTGNTDAVRLLLARGADPLRRNAAGETPLDLARRLGWDRQISSRGGDGVVWVLEGAASEAEAVAAAAAAIEAEKAAARGAAVFHGEDWKKACCHGGLGDTCGKNVTVYPRDK